MADLAPTPLILAGEGWADYALLDSGDGRKFERYGPRRFVRPEPQAPWRPRLAGWDADGEFVPGPDEDGGGRWVFARDVPRDGWPLAWADVRFTARCTPFRHLGCFPDMAPVWAWTREQLDPPRDGEGAARGANGGGSPPPPRERSTSPSGGGSRGTLHLFGYTGVGTLALSRHGPVTHVDASKKSVAQARANAALSAMDTRPIRWLVDDAGAFAAREVRRGRRYDGVMLDPPKFGRGPGGETWRIEQHLAPLIADCRRLLDADSRFLFLSVYAVRMSALALAGLLAEHFADLPGAIEFGELALREQGPGARLLPTAIFARWRNRG